MQLEDYFEFEKTDRYERIRIKGSRIAVETVIDAFLNGESAEQILENYPTLTLEEVYATITYYLHNQADVDGYIARTRAAEEAAYQEYLKQEPPEVVKRLRALKAQQQQKSGSPQ
jgi:uncharacterized protein (DUF433 family)